MRMDRQQTVRCREVVAEYRASGQKCGVWAAAHGMTSHGLSSWCNHAAKWQAMVDGVDVFVMEKPVYWTTAFRHTSPMSGPGRDLPMAIGIPMAPACPYAEM